MSSCLRGGGGRAYGFDLDIIKCPSPPTRSSHSSPSSPSSTLSENSNSVPLAISTKKARTPRKRPNQTYTEAAALLSKIYPNIFSTTNLRKHCKFTRPHDSLFLDTSELLPPFPGLSDAGFLLHHGGQLVLPDKQNSQFELKSSQNSISPKCCTSRNQSYAAGTERTDSIDDGDDFDTESILDEEIGEGIDSIMGNLRCGEDETSHDYSNIVNPYLGHLGCGRFQTNVTRALRSIGNGEWWCSSPTVEMQNIVPELKKSPPSPSPSSSPALLLPEKKKKKKKTVSINSKDAKPNSNSNVNSKKDDKSSKSEAVVEKSTSSPTSSSSSTTSAGPSGPSSLKPALSLKLNYDGVMKEWTGRGSPFSEASGSSESPADIIARLSDIDLLSEVAGSGGLREASVLRYKEKRRSRLFSKKIRYQVRKVNADRRPRAKGKFSTTDAEE